jgi:hypothetical protein
MQIRLESGACSIAFDVGYFERTTPTDSHSLIRWQADELRCSSSQGHLVDEF